jgi:hypothetical protein
LVLAKPGLLLHPPTFLSLDGRGSLNVQAEGEGERVIINDINN